MKSIKYVFPAILLFFTLIVSAQTTWTWSRTGDIVNVSYNTITINTPNFNPVIVGEWLSGEWSSNTKADMVNYYQGQYGNRLTFVSEATFKYNCHSYAWTSRRDVCMNSPERDKYFTTPDFSYEYSSWQTGNKVAYVSDDHSAISANSNTNFTSKWGKGPLFNHHKNDSPYDASSVSFYEPLKIKGSDYIVSSENYSLAIADATTIWTLTRISGSTSTVISMPNNIGKKVTVSVPNDPPYQQARLSTIAPNGRYFEKMIFPRSIFGIPMLCLTSIFNLTNLEVATWSVVDGPFTFIQMVDNGTRAVFSTSAPAGMSGTIKTVTSDGKTHTFPIEQCYTPLQGPENICMTSPPVTYTMPSGTTSGWTVAPPNRFEKVSYNATSCTVRALTDDGLSGVIVGGGILKTIYATCSKGGGAGEEVNMDTYVSAFPNPVSGILNIEIDASAHALELKSKSIAKAPAYDVRLMDSQAVSRRQTSTQGGTVQFDVSNLPNGIYHLLVHDGISAPLLRQIVVEH